MKTGFIGKPRGRPEREAIRHNRARSPNGQGLRRAPPLPRSMRGARRMDTPIFRFRLSWLPREPLQKPAAMIVGIIFGGVDCCIGSGDEAVDAGGGGV